MKKILKLLSVSLKIKYLLLSAISIIGSYLISLTPVYLGRVLDSITVEISGIVNHIVAFAALFLFSEFISISRRVSVDRVSAKFEEELRNSSIRKLLRLPIKELTAKGVSGELSSRINQSINGSSQLMKLLPNDILPAIFTGFFVVVQCIGQAPLGIAAIMLGYIVSTLSISLLQIRSQRGIRENIIKEKTKLDGEMGQCIAGVEQIRALGAEDDESIRLSPLTMGIRIAEYRHHTIMGMFDASKHLIKVVFFAGILLIGISHIAKGSMTGGNVLSIVLLFQALIKPIDEFYRFIDEISTCSVKVDMLNDIMSLENDSAFEISDGENVFDDTTLVITDYEVLAPDDGKVISKGDSIVFQTGKATALVAKTGCGKSSLMKGIIRIYPLQGIVKLLGVDLKNVSQKSLVQLVHYIPQSPFFFAGNVRNNLLYGLPSEPSDDELIKALKDACIYEDLLKSSLGQFTPLDHPVQENGKNFSGGQLKRLAITRAFLRKPKLYVLDESLTNIDEQTVNKILANFELHAKKIDAGIVHISHDRCIISSCNETVRLEPVP